MDALGRLVLWSLAVPNIPLSEAAGAILSKKVSGVEWLFVLAMADPSTELGWLSHQEGIGRLSLSSRLALGAASAVSPLLDPQQNPFRPRCLKKFG